MDKRKIDRAANEKMNMIRHNDISADSDPSRQTCFTKIYELLMHTTIGQKLPPMMSIESDEVQRWIVLLENKLQPWGGDWACKEYVVVEALVPSACFIEFGV